LKQKSKEPRMQWQKPKKQEEVVPAKRHSFLISSVLEFSMELP
jgi:hypothetical protein